MPSRVIKESIWTSPNMNRLSFQAERHFFRLLPLPDDHGCCEVTALVVKGRCYPLQENVTIKEIQKWTEELEEFDIIRTWSEGGRIFAFFPTWKQHQRIRSLHQRKTPLPPEDVVNRRQVKTNDRPIPIPIPNHNLLPPTEGAPSDATTKKVSKTHPRLMAFQAEWKSKHGREYIVGNYSEEGGAASRTASKIPEDDLFLRAVRAYLACTDRRIVEAGHPFLWFVREINRWVTAADPPAHVPSNDGLDKIKKAQEEFFEERKNLTPEQTRENLKKYREDFEKSLTQKMAMPE